MSREISLGHSCPQNCMKKHTTGRDHKVMELKRFKTQLNQFLYMDDDHWLPAFSLQTQLDSLIETIKAIKTELDDKIIEKRLMYALGLDSDSNLLRIFKLANQDAFAELTCGETAVIAQKIEKTRKPRASEIQDLISKLMKEERNRLTLKIAQSFSIFKDTEEKVAIRPLPKRQQPARGQRRPPADKQESARVSNDLPTVRINEIEDTQGHFNIALKVLKVKKQFYLGNNNKKIELEGGDETGVAIAVVDAMRMVRTDKCIMIHNARVYSFHGIKQIQQHNKNSFLEELTRDIRVSDTFNFSEGKRRRHQKDDRSEQGSTTGNRDKEERTYVAKNKEKVEERQPYRPREYDRQSRPVHDRPRANFDRTRDETREETEANDRSYLPNRSQRPERRPERPRERNRDEPDTNGQSKLEVTRTQAAKDQPVRNQVKRQQDKSGYNSSDQAEQQERPTQTRQDSKNDFSKTDKKLIKIKDLIPDMVEDLVSVIAEVIQIRTNVKVGKNCLFAILGDQSGIIWAELPQHHPGIRVNAVLYLKKIEVNIHESEHRLMLKINEETNIEKTNMRMVKINLENDMSEQTWIEEEEEEEEEEKPQKSKKEIVEDF